MSHDERMETLLEIVHGVVDGHGSSPQLLRLNGVWENQHLFLGASFMGCPQGVPCVPESAMTILRVWHLRGRESCNPNHMTAVFT